VLTALPAGSAGTVLAGPVVGDGHVWPKVDFGTVGWVASAFLGPSAPPITPQGLRIQVVDGPLNLRDAPSLGGSVIIALPTGTMTRVAQADGGTWAGGYHWVAGRVEAQHPVDGFVADAFTAERRPEMLDRRASHRYTGNRTSVLKSTILGISERGSALLHCTRERRRIPSRFCQRMSASEEQRSWPSRT
jgi:hypothetical protein